MLTLRPEQMAAFADAAESSFVAEMAEHLLRVFPEHLAGLSTSQRRALIRSRIAQARDFDLRLRGDVRRYLEVSIFSRWPDDGPPERVENALRREDLTPSERMDLVEQATLNGPV